MREVIDVKAAPSAMGDTPSPGKGGRNLKLNPGIKQGNGGLLFIDTSLHTELFCKESLSSVYAVDPEPLARGKFTTVRRCVQHATGKEFAAKLVRKRGRWRDELTHEVAVLAQALGCPHIVTLHHVFDSPKELVLILELARGGDLQTILDEDRIPSEVDTAKCLRDVLRGLLFLHRHNLAHLDIKPQNIVLSGEFPDCDFKLCDFGISRLITKDAEVREIMGTPDYVAPEVLNYEPIGLATDMWSVGVLTYVLLTGCSPFGGETKQDTFCNITKAELDFPDDLFHGISDVAKDFITRLLAKNPSERMTVEECMKHPWLKTGNGEVTRPDSIQLVTRQESCPACGSGNTTPVNPMVPFPALSPSSFLDFASASSSSSASSTRRCLSNLTPSTDSLDSDTSVETVRAVDFASSIVEATGDGFHASRRYSASTETVTAAPVSQRPSSVINYRTSSSEEEPRSKEEGSSPRKHKGQKREAVFSLRTSPYSSQRRLSMESLVPKSAGSFNSIPETVSLRDSTGDESSSGSSTCTVTAATSQEFSTGLASPSASAGASPLPRPKRPSLERNGHLGPHSGEETEEYEMAGIAGSSADRSQNVPCSFVMSELEVVQASFIRRGSAPSGDSPSQGQGQGRQPDSGHINRQGRAFSVPTGGIHVSVAMWRPTVSNSSGHGSPSGGEDSVDYSSAAGKHNHSHNCCPDSAEAKRHHQKHPLVFQHQSEEHSQNGHLTPSHGTKDLSPSLSRLSSETSSERSSGVFSDCSEPPSDSSSDRSSVMSWEEAAEQQRLHAAELGAAGQIPPRFVNSLEERFADLQLWESVWDDIHYADGSAVGRGRGRLCPGVRHGSVDTSLTPTSASRPWERVCSGIVARAQAQIVNQSARKSSSPSTSDGLYCRSLGRTLGSSVTRSVAMLAEKAKKSQSQETPESERKPKKPVRAPPLPPGQGRIAVVAAPGVKKLSTAFEDRKKQEGDVASR